MKSVRNILIAITASGIMWACEPTPDEIKLFDEFVVSTNYDPSASFSEYTTYTMLLDTIGLVSNLPSDDTIIVGTNYARPVVNAVRSNLNSRGFQFIDRTNDPDLAINVFVLKNLNIFQQVNYFPGYAYPGYFPGYYGYYGYNFYPIVSTQAYNSGVLVIEMIDLRNVTPQNTVRVVWNAYMGDVFHTLDLMQQTLDAINQSFIQSPYVQR